jgi:predicted sulfurtransferase
MDVPGSDREGAPRASDGTRGSALTEETMAKASAVILALVAAVPALAAAEFTNLTAEEVHAALVSGRAVLVDARTPDEYAQAHLPGAINVFAPTVSASRALLPKDPATRIIFYCRGVG